MTAEKVTFGYRLVSTAEKKRLVREQFDPIARTYDLADALLSFGLHFYWKRSGIKRLNLKQGQRVLDICGGTADFALLAARRIGPRGWACVYDFSWPMIKSGITKVERSRFKKGVFFVQGDAEDLGFPDRSFDAITVGFGVRNLAHLDDGLREMYRVLKPGGRLMVLEFSLPVLSWQRRLYDFYSFRLMPFGARIICGDDKPFRYLAESIRVFDSPEQVSNRLWSAGFSEVRFRRLTFGVAVIYLGQRP